MTFDTHSLFGYSTVASVSGTSPNLSITVQTGEGANFAVGQNVTTLRRCAVSLIWPPGGRMGG